MFANPSVYAHTFGGGIFLIGILYSVLNFSKLYSKDTYQILVLILLFSVAMSVHGISHAGLEALYGYNPYYMITGKTVEPWYPDDCPYRRRNKCPFRRRDCDID
jgi:disulfide bond formation protein DsbB